MIAFIGSVFSPYYAWSGRRDPLDHCAINIAAYGPGGRRWAMTERGRRSLSRDSDHLAIGPSSLVWEDSALTIAFDEVTSPRPSRLRGVVRLRPGALNRQAFALDAAGRHVWRPIAPRADVEVEFQGAGRGWRGQGYFDTNAGDEPLENGFASWDWSRGHRRDDTLLFYDVVRREGDAAHLALRAAADGVLHAVDPPPRIRLSPTRWRIPRVMRGDTGAAPEVRSTLEDTPFYARTALRGLVDGEPAEIVHESLSLNRLRSPIVRAMLPVRMPRIFW